MYNVLTTAAAFQVILEAEEGDNQPRLKTRVFKDRYICFTAMFLSVYELFFSAPPPLSGSTCRHITVQGSCYS